MAHSYVSSLYHVVFSTAGRIKSIDEQLQPRLWSYMGGIARENKFKALIIGGVEDHVHLLLSLSSTMAVAKAVQLVKGGSSKWVHDSFRERGSFEWQEGYGAFSIGISQVEGTKSYILNQKNRHRKMSFKEEYLSFLKRNEIDYDERYVWG